MDISPWTNKINLILGTIAALLTYFLGEHWILFAAFLALNVVDYITGYLKSRINGKVNSKKGAAGILKKFGYWLMVLISFLMSTMFIKIGEVIGIDLKVTELLGWFVLATLIINELHSIFENFIEAGYELPPILTKGLEAASSIMDKIGAGEEDKKE